MVRKTLSACALTAALAGAANLHAQAQATASTRGPFGFEPIGQSANTADWNPAAPWVIPAGFTQTVVSDESALNIYDRGRDDWTDMSTVNETGREAGRYLYRTHEARLPDSLPQGGALSVVDLQTGRAKILAQDPSYDALDGIRWTPWGTLLFGEEVGNGRLFEIVLDPDDPTSGTVYERPALGRFAHEGIEVGPDGAVYLVDEQRGLTDATGCDRTPCGGGIYKFVPDRPGDLASGKLYVLRVLDDADQEGVGQAEWAGPIDPLTVRASGSAIGGTSYQRPEDVEIIGDTLFVAITEGTPNPFGIERYGGRVIAVNLSSLMVTNYVKPGVNVPIEIGRPGDKGFQTGFDNPDNLAESPDGRLVIVEDNVPSDIWVASADHDQDGAADAVWLFASLSDPGAEGTGLCFGKDPKTLFVNVQHSAAADGDATWAITKAQ